MITITIPITESLNDFINEQVKLGHSANKADLVRKSLQKMKEDMFIESILNAKKEAKEGKLLQGDVIKLAKHFKD